MKVSLVTFKSDMLFQVKATDNAANDFTKEGSIFADFGRPRSATEYCPFLRY